jgi:hypothetical protein
MDEGSMGIFEWLIRHPERLAWTGGLSAVAFLAILAAAPIILLALPRDYLSGHPPPLSAGWPRPWRWIYRVGKNAVGGILMLAGVAMLVLPGQGLLTLAVGLMLTDVPAKRRMLRRLLGRERVLARVNRLRRRFDRPPLAPP